MVIHRKSNNPLKWLKTLFSSRPALPSEIERAKDVLSAIDKGGMPLNPAKINAIARDLGLEVHRTARPEETIARIREALKRSSQWC